MADDSTSSIVKFAIIGVAAYLGYKYLQSSGLWVQWFGGTSTFTDPASLQAYCTANPSGTATYNGQTGTCAQWMQAIAAAGTHASNPPTTSNPAPTTPTPSPADAQLASNLVAAAKVQPSATMNVWQWNYVLLHMTPTETNLNTSNNAQEMTAGQYVAARHAAGLSGLAWAAPMLHSQIPYRWVN